MTIDTDFDYWSLIINSDEKGARDIGEGQWRFAKTWASQKGCKGRTWLPWGLQPSPSNWLQKTGKTAPKRQTDVCNKKRQHHAMPNNEWLWTCHDLIFLCSLKLTSCNSQNCQTSLSPIDRFCTAKNAKLQHLHPWKRLLVQIQLCLLRSLSVYPVSCRTDNVKPYLVSTVA